MSMEFGVNLPTAARHFSSRFKEGNKCRPTFNSSLFRRISVVDVNFLEADISMDEIKSVVWDCDGSKAPRPDDLNFKFIKSYWEIIKYDFFNCVKYFEATGKFASRFISKILASRLAKVIPSIIGPNQTAFIERRQILDGCLVANEIIRMANIEDLNLMIFKIDAYLSMASISVMVNESPSKKFKMERGLRQGDPLSLFLFLIVVEALQMAVLEACCKGIFKVIKEFYGESGGFGSLVGLSGPNGIWCDIIKAMEDIETIDPSFKRSFHIKVLNGANVSFWKDPWCANRTSQWLLGGNWHWRRPPRGRANNDVMDLVSMIGNLYLSSASTDRWSWSKYASGIYKDRVDNIKQEDIFLSIQRISKIWISACASSRPANWNCWIAHLFDLFGFV
ncbi:hypothetical protein Tco_1006822 [Tanacetum coccineum]|uniref:Reverse transcriptase n=1 Tax=Tanacetum coccineum TaxID=301880 RepID=A0ABQ5FJZ0_9ASTR